MKTNNSKITIDENYSISGDKYNWVLHFERKGELNQKTGKPIISKDEWYFPKLELCLKEYANQKTKTATNYKELVSLLVDINNTIKSL